MIFRRYIIRNTFTGIILPKRHFTLRGAMKRYEKLCKEWGYMFQIRRFF